MSEAIADCQFPIADSQLNFTALLIGNRQLAIGNPLTHHSLNHARIHFTSSPRQRHSQFKQRNLVAVGLPLHPAGSHSGTQNLSARRRLHINALSDFVSDISLLSRRHQIPRARTGSSAVFHYPGQPHDSGSGNCAVDTDYALSRNAGRLHQAPAYRALDAATLAVRFSDWRDCLPDALSLLPGALTKTIRTYFSLV